MNFAILTYAETGCGCRGGHYYLSDRRRCHVGHGLVLRKHIPRYLRNLLTPISKIALPQNRKSVTFCKREHALIVAQALEVLTSHDV